MINLAQIGNVGPLFRQSFRSMGSSALFLLGEEGSSYHEAYCEMSVYGEWSNCKFMMLSSSWSVHVSIVCLQLVLDGKGR